MVRENTLHREDLIMPVFIDPRADTVREIPSMPGICNYGLDTVGREIEAILAAGIRQVILFGVPPTKDAVGSDTWDDEHGIIQRATRKLKAEWPELFVITDVCFCEYTTHGHCGVVADDVFSTNNLNQRSEILGQTVDFNLGITELGVQPVGLVLRLDAAASFDSTPPAGFVGSFQLPTTYPQDDGAGMLRLNLNPNFVNQLLAGFWASGKLKLNLMELIGSLGGGEGASLPFETTAASLGGALGAPGLADLVGADAQVGIEMDPQLPPIITPGEDADSLVVDLGEVHFHFTHSGETRWATIATHLRLTIATDADPDAGETVLAVDVSADLVDEPVIDIDDETAEEALNTIFKLLPALVGSEGLGGTFGVGGMSSGNPGLSVASMDLRAGAATGGFISLLMELGKETEVHQGRDLNIIHTAVNPLNGHTLHMLERSSWRDAESMAQRLGGHLVTIRSEAENDWILETFGELDRTERDFWIGLHDSVVEGRFTWVSGEAVTWDGWRRGRPDNGADERRVNGSEDYVHMYGRRHSRRGQWNDAKGLPQADWNEGFFGIVEVTDASNPDGPE